MASWYMNLPTLLCDRHWVHRPGCIPQWQCALDVLCQMGIIVWEVALLSWKNIWCRLGVVMPKILCVLVDKDPQL